jgi:hypothetical protein
MWQLLNFASVEELQEFCRQHGLVLSPEGVAKETTVSMGSFGLNASGLIDRKATSAQVVTFWNVQLLLLN